MTTGDVGHVSVDKEDFSESDAKNLADFIAKCQSGRIESTSAVKLVTETSVEYIMPNHITWLARVED
jgi:hypothetical protein